MGNILKKVVFSEERLKVEASSEIKNLAIGCYVPHEYYVTDLLNFDIESLVNKEKLEPKLQNLFNEIKNSLLFIVPVNDYFMEDNRFDIDLEFFMIFTFPIFRIHNLKYPIFIFVNLLEDNILQMFRKLKIGKKITFMIVNEPLYKVIVEGKEMRKDIKYKYAIIGIEINYDMERIIELVINFLTKSENYVMLTKEIYEEVADFIGQKIYSLNII